MTALSSTQRRPPRRRNGSNTQASDPLQDALGSYLAQLSEHPLLTTAEEIELAQTIEAGHDAAGRLSGTEAVSLTERTRLNRLVRSGEAAKEHFLNANLRLVVANARRYVPPPGIDLLDLIQEGNLGLVRAVEKFDWRRGFKFSTYATWWIRQAISRALAEKARIVRLPAHLANSLPLVAQAQTDLRRELGRTPRPEEIASATGLTVTKIHAALEVPATVSLQAPLGDDQAPFAVMIHDEQAVDPSIEAETKDIADRLTHAVARLPEREGHIIALRFGLPESEPQSLSDIAKQFGLTGSRIRQIEKRALAQLRHPASGLREEDFL